MRWSLLIPVLSGLLAGSSRLPDSFAFGRKLFRKNKAADNSNSKVETSGKDELFEALRKFNKGSNQQVFKSHSKLDSSEVRVKLVFTRDGKKHIIEVHPPKMNPRDMNEFYEVTNEKYRKELLHNDLLRMIDPKVVSRKEDLAEITRPDEQPLGELLDRLYHEKRGLVDPQPEARTLKQLKMWKTQTREPPSVQIIVSTPSQEGGVSLKIQVGDAKIFDRSNTVRVTSREDQHRLLSFVRSALATHEPLHYEVLDWSAANQP